MFGVHINIPRDILETEKGQMRTVKVTGLPQGTEDCKVEIARMLSAYSQDLSLELCWRRPQPIVAIQITRPWDGRVQLRHDAGGAT